MSNEVEIRVKVTTDKSGLTAIRRDAEAEGRATGAAFSKGAEGGFGSFLGLLGRNAGLASGSLGGLTNNIYVMAAAAALGAPTIATLAGALLVLPAAGGAAAAVLGTLGLALSGVSDALGAQGGVSAEMAKSGASAAAMARQIRDAVDSVNDARQAAARVAEDSARRIDDAERNTAQVARDGAESIAAAKQRVQDAAEQSAEAIEAANQRLADTEEQVARQILDAERSLADVRAQAARTLERTARSGADAVANAADRVAKALDREQDAQENLSQARQDAARDLEDLQAKVAGYAADEQSAQARVARAAENLRKMNAARRFSDIDRQEAAAELAEAEQHLADVQRTGQRNASDLAKVQAGGIDSTKKVQDATERLADAHAAVTDATKDQARAEQDAAAANAEAARSSSEAIANAEDRLARAREDGAKRVKDAERAVAQAVEDGSKRQAEARAALARTERAASEANQAAARAEADARRQAAQAQADAADRVKDAEQRLNDVYAQQREQAAQTAAATNTYAAALAKLSPNAQAFVEAIRQLRPEWEALQQSVQNNAFVGLATTVRALSDTYLPVLTTWLTQIATVLNEMVRYAADALMKPESVQAVNDVLANTKIALDNAKTALGDFLSGFLALMSVGAQYLPQFGAWIADIARRFAEWANSKEGRAEVKRWIEAAFTAFGNLWAICKDIFIIFQQVCSALGISGGGMLQGLRDLCDWLVRVAQNPNTIAFLRGVRDVVIVVGQAIAFCWPTIRDLIGWLVNLANNAVTVARAVKGSFAGLWGGLTAGAKAGANGAIAVLNGLIQAANWAIRAFNILPGPDLPQFGMFPYLAKGGIAGGMAVVGENGPELVKLPQGSTVYPAGQSRGMADKLGGGGSGGPSRIELVVSGNTDQALAQALMRMINGGQIQIRQSKLVAG